MILHHWFKRPLQDLHDVIYTFLSYLHESRFTTFQKGKDSICNFWEDEVHIDLQQNSFEATLHLLTIWKKYREVLFSEELRFKQSEKNWKYLIHIHISLKKCCSFLAIRLIWVWKFSKKMLLFFWLLDLYGYENFQKKCCYFLAIRLIWVWKFSKKMLLFFGY